MTTEIQPTRPTSGEQKRPDPEVVERARRRTFTAEYRMAIRGVDMRGRSWEPRVGGNNTHCEIVSIGPEQCVLVFPHPRPRAQL